MELIIVGLGSMGRRRIGLLRNHFDRMNLIGVDSREDRRMQCEREFQIKTTDTLMEALEEGKAAAAFICTGPLSHHSIITKCLEQGLHVFTELNLVADGYERNMALAREQGRILFLSSTALYRKEMEFVREQVKAQDIPPDYRYHIGQYLPDWHPWESFHDFFVGDKRTNGCREIFAIELPWLLDAFGSVKKLHVLSRRLTSLSIDYDDSYQVLLEHENGSRGSISVDVVCREPVRKLEVYGEKLYLEWNGKPDTLMIKNREENRMETVSLYENVVHKEGYSKTIIENQYLDEIHAFFQALEGSKLPAYGFREDLVTLALIDRIEGGNCV